MEMEENYCSICYKESTNVFSTKSSVIFFKLLYDVYGSLPRNTQNKGQSSKHVCIQCAQNIETVSAYTKISKTLDLKTEVKESQCRICQENFIETEKLYQLSDLPEDFQTKMEFFVKTVLKTFQYEPSWRICLKCSAGTIYWDKFHTYIFNLDPKPENKIQRSENKIDTFETPKMYTAAEAQQNFEEILSKTVLDKQLKTVTNLQEKSVKVITSVPQSVNSVKNYIPIQVGGKTYVLSGESFNIQNLTSISTAVQTNIAKPQYVISGNQNLIPPLIDLKTKVNNTMAYVKSSIGYVPTQFDSNRFVTVTSNVASKSQSESTDLTPGEKRWLNELIKRATEKPFDNYAPKSVPPFTEQVKKIPNLVDLSFKEIWKLKYNIASNKQLMIDKPYVRLPQFNFEDYTCSWCRKSFSTVFKATKHELRHCKFFSPKVKLDRLPNHVVEYNLHGKGLNLNELLAESDLDCYTMLECETVYSDNDEIVINDSDEDNDNVNDEDYQVGNDHTYTIKTKKPNYLGAFNTWLNKKNSAPTYLINQGSIGSQGPNLGSLGPTFGSQGPNLGSLGPTFGSQGPNLGSLGPTLGLQDPTLGLHVPNLGSLGPSLGSQGPTVGLQGSTLGSLGPSLGSQGPSLGSQGPTLGLQGSTLGSQAPNLGLQGPMLGLQVSTVGLQGSNLGSQGLTLGSQGPILGSQGPILGSQGPTMGSQGPISGSQGPILGSQGPILGSQGPTMGSQGPTLGSQAPTLGSQGPTMGSQGPILGSQGPTMGSQGPTLGSQAPTLGSQGPTMGSQGPILGSQGPILGSQGPILGSQGASKTLQSAQFVQIQVPSNQIQAGATLSTQNLSLGNQNFALTPMEVASKAAGGTQFVQLQIPTSQINGVGTSKQPQFYQFQVPTTTINGQLHYVIRSGQNGILPNQNVTQTQQSAIYQNPNGMLSQRPIINYVPQTQPNQNQPTVVQNKPDDDDDDDEEGVHFLLRRPKVAVKNTVPQNTQYLSNLNLNSIQNKQILNRTPIAMAPNTSTGNNYIVFKAPNGTVTRYLIPSNVKQISLGPSLPGAVTAPRAPLGPTLPPPDLVLNPFSNNNVAVNVASSQSQSTAGQSSQTSSDNSLLIRHLEFNGQISQNNNNNSVEPLQSQVPNGSLLKGILTENFNKILTNVNNETKGPLIAPIKVRSDLF